jgi:hypothetical protein
MSYVNLVHLKPLLMVIAAATGTVGSGVMMNAYANGHHDPGTFLLTLNPSSMTMVANTSVTSSIGVTSINGFTGTVGLSLSFLGAKLVASISPTSVTVPANSVAHSTLSVAAGNTLGSYTIIFLGVSSDHGKTTYSSAELTVQVVSSQDYSITASPNTINSPTGSTNTTVITITSINGYTGNVSLTFTAPFGYFTLTGGANPLRIVSGGAASTSLTITTSTSTIQGTYTITVTGTDGSKTHTATILVTVVDPTPPPFINEGLKLNSYTFNNGTMLTLALQNTGNGSITITSYVIRDSSGDAWSQTNYSGPSIAVNSAGTAIILIGSSCPSCTYTGITGLFFTFQHGQSYTVTVTTARNNQFTFTVSY